MMKKKLNFFLIVLFFIFYAVESIKVKLSKQFPIYENEEYQIRFSTNTDKLPLYTIIILQCVKSDNILENAIINPGFLKGLPKPIFGDCFTVLSYKIIPPYIDVIVTFNRKSNSSDLQIIYLETASQSQRVNLIDEAKKLKATPVLTVQISLLLHWTLTIIQKTLDHREGGLIAGSKGVLICNAKNGFPFSKATLVGVDTLTEVPPESYQIDEKENEAYFAFMPSLKDHLKQICCRAGRDEITANIAIYHHPTTVNIVPYVSGYVKNGSVILCKGSDGFPSPTSKWEFRSGPQDAESYFFINNSGSTLHLKNDAPIGSKWMFHCVAKNSIPNSINNGVVKEVSFIVGERPFPIMLMAWLTMAFLALMLTVGVLIWFCRSEKCSSKKTSVGDSGANHGIISYRLQKNSLEKKEPLINGSMTSSTKHSSHHSSLSSTNKEKPKRENNPVDLV